MLKQLMSPKEGEKTTEIRPSMRGLETAGLCAMVGRGQDRVVVERGEARPVRIAGGEGVSRAAAEQAPAG